MKKKFQDRYVVKKYVMARSAMDAIKKERNYPVNDVWVDENFKKELPSAIGFQNESDE